MVSGGVGLVKVKQAHFAEAGGGVLIDIFARIIYWRVCFYFAASTCRIYWYSTLTYVIHMHFTIERKKGEICMIVQIMGSIYEGIVICILKPQHASLKAFIYLLQTSKFVHLHKNNLYEKNLCREKFISKIEFNSWNGLALMSVTTRLTPNIIVLYIFFFLTIFVRIIL